MYNINPQFALHYLTFGQHNLINGFASIESLLRVTFYRGEAEGRLKETAELSRPDLTAYISPSRTENKTVTRRTRREGGGVVEARAGTVRS